MNGDSNAYWSTLVDMEAHALEGFSGEHASVDARFQHQEPSFPTNDLWTLPDQNRHRDDMPNEYWQPHFQPIYPMPEFNPTYLTCGDADDEHILNAIFEIKALWEYVVNEALHNYSSMYAQLWLPITTAALKQMCQRHKEVFAVYDKQTKTWLVHSNEPKYKYCFNGEDFEEFETAREKTTGNRLLLMGKYTILMQEPNLVRETRVTSSMVNNFQKPSAKLIVGVPGCGKTTYIIDNHSWGSLVLTSGTEAAADIRSRMGQLNDCGASRFRDSYRTIDSYLLNSRRQYREVWIDEALMEHPGKLFLVCLYSHCQVMYMLGDPNQLGYINRVDGIHLFYEKAADFFNATEVLNVSYRCPVDVMAKISCKYDGGAFSTSDILRSAQCREYASLENVPNDDATKYLVFKQAEKKAMLKYGYKVSTIHEFQGKEANDVVIVRMSRNLHEPLYDSVPHILVGMTRHRKSLVYYTPVADDLHNLINMPLTDEQLRTHQRRPTSPLGFYNDLDDIEDLQDIEVLGPINENSSLVGNRIPSSASEEESSLITVIMRGVFSVFRWGVCIVRKAVSIAVSAWHWIWSWLR